MTRVIRSIAFRVNRKLLSFDWQGDARVPGGGCAPAVFEQFDGQKLGLVARGDMFDVYITRRTGPALNVVLTRATGIELGKWLFRWWVFESWFGLKHRLWYWSVSALMNVEKAPRKHG
jgi:hypothetical protein